MGLFGWLNSWKNEEEDNRTVSSSDAGPEEELTRQATANANIELGKRFFDTVSVTYDTSGFATPEEAIESMIRTAVEQRELMHQAGNQEMVDFYTGFLKCCD